MAVSWGIISTAHINRLIISAARLSREVDLAAVASRDQSRAESYARANDIERAYGSYEALLEDPAIDAVYISLPNSMHVEWSIRALEAGKHVLCEKPLSRRAREVEEAFDVADRSGRLLMEAFMYRHSPQSARLKELVEEGAVGRVRLIRGAFSFFLDVATNIRLSSDLDGGSLMDVGCYCVNSARFLAGEPESVSAHQVTGPSGVDILFAGTMRFPGDVIAQFDSGLCLPDRDELEVIGEEGSLFLDDPWHCVNPGIELRRNGEEKHISVEANNPYTVELENFSAALRGDATPLLGREDAVGQARTIEALYRSAEQGKAIALAEL
jgi:xylose dehydrogenase (NAD/NADP)